MKIRVINSWDNKIISKYKKVVDNGKIGENVPKLESVEVILVHCNLVKKWLSACIKSII